MQIIASAIRTLRRAPGFTATATLVLTLAVGAATTTFALLNALVLRELPVPRADELVQLHTRDPLDREADLTWRQFQELTRQQRVFSAVLGWIGQAVFTVDTRNGQQQRSVMGVSGNFFDELGARPVIGRLIQPGDVDIDTTMAQPVAVLGWTYWQEQFGGGADIIGDSVRVQGVTLEIIGVAPPRFRGLGITIEPDVTVPLSLVPTISEAEPLMVRGTARWVATTGRLAQGETLESARAQLIAAWPAIQTAAAPPESQVGLLQDSRKTTLHVHSGSRGVERGLRGRYATPLLALLGISALVLLAAGANIASLMFARLDARQHEMEIRLALGAGRVRMLMDIAAEGAVLGALGAIGGIAFAWYATTAITTLLLRDYVVRTSLDVTPDGFVAGVAGAAAVAIGSIVAITSALIVLRSRAVSPVTVARRSGSRSRRIGRVMVGVQVALSLVLVAHASVLARSLQKLETRPSGLTTDSVLVSYPQQRLGMYERTDPTAYYMQALERVQHVPGVSAAAFSRARPQAGALPLQPVGIARGPAEGDAQAEIAAVSPGFFDALGIHIVSGRAMSFSDNARAPRVAVISQTLEARLFGAGQGLGKEIRVSSDPAWHRTVVIGIAGDASVFDVRGGNQSIVYTPALQAGNLAHFKYLIVRATIRASRDIERAIESLGVEMLPSLQSVSYIRGRTILQERMLGALGGYFGVLGLLVVIVGLHGLLSYVLSLRRREFGLYMAIGATTAQVARLIFTDALAIAASGMLIGLAVVLASTRLVSRVLVDTDPADPLALAFACLAILAASSVAAAIPALRAARIDPATELRAE